jgi:hypothetical protein
MSACNHDDLLELARGELAPEKAAEVESHAAECASCTRELGWLRTERALFRARTAEPAAHVWQAVERRIVIAREEKRVRRQRWMQVGSGAMVFAAAAAFLVALWGHGMPEPVTQQQPASSTQPAPPQADDPTDYTAANQALDAAELQYQTVIKELAVAYREERDRRDPEDVLRLDEELRSLRKQLRAERAAAQDDVWARRRVLRTYSAYVRTMQAMVQPHPEVSQ